MINRDLLRKQTELNPEDLENTFKSVQQTKVKLPRKDALESIATNIINYIYDSLIGYIGTVTMDSSFEDGSVVILVEDLGKTKEGAIFLGTVLLHGLFALEKTGLVEAESVTFQEIPKNNEFNIFFRYEGIPVSVMFLPSETFQDINKRYLAEHTLMETNDSGFNYSFDERHDANLKDLIPQATELLHILSKLEGYLDYNSDSEKALTASHELRNAKRLVTNILSFLHVKKAK